VELFRRYEGKTETYGEKPYGCVKLGEKYFTVSPKLFEIFC
jgi:hypothetical protein